MISLSKKDFKRNPTVIQSIKQVGSSIKATTDLYIIFPSIHVDKDMAIIDNVCSIYGLLAICDMNYNYIVLTVPTLVEVSPESIEEIDIDGVLYYRLTILKNDLVIDDVNVVVLTDMAYLSFDLLLRKGKVPFYVEYEDMLTLFSKLNKYTSNNVTSFIPVLKLIIGITARSGTDIKVPYKLTLTTNKDLGVKPVQWISMNNIYFSFNSTLAKIGSSYMKEGMISAIVNPEERATDYENVIRQ